MAGGQMAYHLSHSESTGFHSVLSHSIGVEHLLGLFFMLLLDLGLLIYQEKYHDCNSNNIVIARWRRYTICLWSL